MFDTHGTLLCFAFQVTSHSSWKGCHRPVSWIQRYGTLCCVDHGSPIPTRSACLYTRSGQNAGCGALGIEGERGNFFRHGKGGLSVPKRANCLDINNPSLELLIAKDLRPRHASGSCSDLEGCRRTLTVPDQDSREWDCRRVRRCCACSRNRIRWLRPCWLPDHDGAKRKDRPLTAMPQVGGIP
jgi:hypothetical protein